MEMHPQGVTLIELDAACDLGSRTKVISDMTRHLGYGIARGPDRWVPCAHHTKWRQVHTYILLHRPAKPAQLSLSLE